MGRDALVGTWRLLRHERFDGDRVSLPFGEKPKGFLVYSPEGFMSVAISGAGRFLAYAGPYERRPGAVVHRVAVCSKPEWTGTRQLRKVTLQARRLTLEAAPFIADGRRVTARVVWTRIG